MTITIIQYIIVTLLGIYTLVTLLFIASLFKKERFGRCIKSNTKPAGVSVVIPFRNEEHNLTALLHSIADQQYNGLFEVIFVNDQSDDNGPEIIASYQKNNANSAFAIKIIDLKDPHNDLTSKQQALDLGVSMAVYPLIAFTDADMILKPNWIESLAGDQQKSGANLIFGHTAISNQRKNGIFAALESFQLELLFCYAYVFSKLNITGSCMGNNLLVTKEHYMKYGGQEGIGYSIVEDRALLKLFRKNGLKTKAQEPFYVTALTHPSKSKKQFFNQMMRWAAGGLHPGGGLFAAGILLFVQNALFLLSIFNITPNIITVLSGANFLLTWIFLVISLRKNKSTASKLMYPFYYIFMMTETVIFGAALMFGLKIVWKDRNLQKSEIDRDSHLRVDEAIDPASL